MTIKAANLGGKELWLIIIWIMFKLFRKKLVIMLPAQPDLI
jgi:hypothetical protein